MLRLLLLVALVVLACEAIGVKTISLHKHHQIHPKLHHRRWMQRSAHRSKRAPVAPVGGDIWPVAIYWAFLSVGTPGVQFPAAIDSGSFTLDIPLRGCQGCVSKPPNTLYRPSSSSSSHLYSCSFLKGCDVDGATCHPTKGYCGFSNSYETCVPTDPTQTCTISGVWYSDQVSWAGSAAVPVQFGAINYQTSNFEQFYNIDGVVGMAGPAGNQSVIGQLANNNAISSWSWGLCLQAGARSNGTLTLGGPDRRLYVGSMQYTPNTGGGTFYQMQLNGMSFGNAPIYIDENQVIIDSGTNILLVPDETYSSMKQVLQSMCSSRNLHGICDVSSSQTLFDGKCYNFTPQQVAAFPNITLSIPGLSPLVIPPASYILQNYGTNYQPGQYCLGIDNTGPQGLQIVGDTLLQNYYVIFDQTNQQIGWAPVSSSCGNL